MPIRTRRLIEEPCYISANYGFNITGEAYKARVIVSNHIHTNYIEGQGKIPGAGKLKVITLRMDYTKLGWAPFYSWDKRSLKVNGADLLIHFGSRDLLWKETYDVKSRLVIKLYPKKVSDRRVMRNPLVRAIRYYLVNL